jgi:hypothetical protein
LWAAAASMLGAAVLTRAAIAKGAYRQGGKRSRFPYAFALALLLPFAIGGSASMGAADREIGTEGASKANAADVLGRLAHGAPKKAAAGKQQVAKVVAPPREMGSGRKDAMAGVILQPKNPRAQSLFVGPAPPVGFGLNRPLTIPFTGEYHVFRTMNWRLPAGSPIVFGTPLTASFITTNGGSMETEAHQSFFPPIDFTYCSRVEVTVEHKETMPASALLRLVAGGKSIDLEMELFGMRPAAEETISFAVPYETRSIKVDAVTLVFHHAPGLKDQSAKVAVKSLTLIPSGM